MPKIWSSGFWNFAPVSEIQPPKFGRFFVKFLTKNARKPVVKGLRAGIYVFTVFSRSVLCNQQVYQVWAAGQAVVGTRPPKHTP